MRRRQQHPMTESNLLPSEQGDSRSKFTGGGDIDEESRGLLSPLELSDHDDKRKTRTLRPRNYNSRKQLIIAGITSGCLFIILLFRKSKGKEKPATNLFMCSFMKFLAELDVLLIL